MSLSLRKIIEQIAAARGIRLEDELVGDRPNFYRFRTRAQRGTLDMDEQLLSMSRHLEWKATAALIDREVTGVQRTLFRATIEHIAKHDREPLDRLKAIDLHARQLIDALGPEAHDNHGPLGNAVRQLERVLVAKPGAVSWQRDGYGKDVTP